MLKLYLEYIAVIGKMGYTFINHSCTICEFHSVIEHSINIKCTQGLERGWGGGVWWGIDQRINRLNNAVGQISVSRFMKSKPVSVDLILAF